MAKKSRRAPADLGPDGKKLYRQILDEYQIEDAHDLRLLQAACGAWDRVVEARAEIGKAGPYFRDRFGQPKEHPGHATERNNKILFARLLRELQLDVEPPESRLPSRY